MDEKTKIEMRLGIAQAVESWWEEFSSTHNIPWVGENIFDNMATAAAQIIIGIDEAQQFNQEEGRFTEE